ncbi:hypothetical protein BC629DRAFT_1586379 [Irpex lacteus]|nr:hypothetical protein BC629DRAFT_1586379 [Irpex lacteus]
MCILSALPPSWDDLVTSVVINDDLTSSDIISRITQDNARRKARGPDQAFNATARFGKKKFRKGVNCHKCGKEGHIRPECNEPDKPASATAVVATADTLEEELNSLPFATDNYTEERPTNTITPTTNDEETRDYVVVQHADADLTNITGPTSSILASREEQDPSASNPTSPPLSPTTSSLSVSNVPSLTPSPHTSRPTSDNESSDDDEYFNMPLPTTSDGMAQALRSSKPKTLPTLTAGTLTPVIVHTFIRYCTMYFRSVKTADDEKVPEIFGCFLDDKIGDWIDQEDERLRKLTLDEFFKEFRTRWLNERWADNLKVDISRAFMRDSEEFAPWKESVILSNSILKGYPL